MPLSEDERNQRADEHIAHYFPTASAAQIERIKTIAVNRFSGNYSPLEDEQDSPSASGTGNTFEEYILCTGIDVTGTYPPEVSRDDLHHIIIRYNM